MPSFGMMFQEKMSGTAGKEDKEDLRVAVAMLRAFRGWSQLDLALAAGLGPSAVSRYESGAQMPSRRTFDRIATAVGVQPTLVRGLLSWIRAARTELAGKPFSMTTEELIEVSSLELLGTLAEVLRYAVADLNEESLPAEERVALDRRVEKELWAQLETLPLEDWYQVLEEIPEARDWPLGMLICEKSLDVAANGNMGKALELAELAIRLAEMHWEEGLWKLRFEGYARAHLAAVLRLAGGFGAAEEAMHRARRLWDAGEPEDPSPLKEDFLLEVEAALQADFLLHKGPS